MSTPIGILTALLAGLYFCTTNFDYSDDPKLTQYFIAIAIIVVVLLVFAIFLLAMVFAEFFRGRLYISINNAERLNDYYGDLVAFYTANPPGAGVTVDAAAQADFEAYLTQEYIRNAANNQTLNRVKTARLFLSNRFMIYALISLSLLIVPFGIDFGRNKGKDKVQKVTIDQALPVNLSIKYQKDTVLRLNIKPKDHGNKTSNSR